MTVRIDTGLGDIATVSAVRTGSTSDTWQAAFGTYDAPGTGQAATAVDATAGKVTVSVTVGNGHYNPVTGSYWLWINRNGADWENTFQRYVVTNVAGSDVGESVNFDAAGAAAAVAADVAANYVPQSNLSALGIFLAEQFGGGPSASASANTAAINAAIAAQHVNGGDIRFAANETYSFDGQIDLTAVRQCTFGGTGGPSAYGLGTRLVYTGTGATPAIICGSSTGLEIANISFGHTSTSFTGRLIDTVAVSNDTQNLSLTRVGMTGPTGGTATMIRLDKGHTYKLDRVTFANCGIGLEGLETPGVSYANGAEISSCHWISGVTVACVKNPGNSWKFTRPVAEPLTSGAGCFLAFDAGFLTGSGGAGLVIDTPWFGDATAAGAWLTPNVYGFVLIGGRIVVPGVAGASAITFTINNTYGVKVYNTNIAVALGGTGIDFGSTTGHASFDLRPVWGTSTGTLIHNPPTTGGIYDTGGGPVLCGPTVVAPIYTGAMSGAASIAVGGVSANQVTTNQASPTATTGFQQNSNATGLTTNAGGGDSTHNSVEWVSVAAGDSSIATSTAGRVPVIAGGSYTMAANIKRSGGTGNGKIDATFFDITGASVGAAGSGTVALSAGYNRLVIPTTVAPVGAVKVGFAFRVLGTTLGETCDLRDFTVNVGTSSTFTTPGGFLTTSDANGVHNTSGAAIDMGVGTTGVVAVTGKVAASNGVDAGSQKVTSVANGSASSDAAAFGQLPTKLSDLAGSNAADVSVNSHKVTNLSNGSASGDAVNYGQLSALTWDQSYFRKGGLSVSTGVLKIYAERAMTIVSVRASLGTAPGSTAVIVDINLNGTTIFSTQANRPTVAVSGVTSGAVTNMNTTAVAAGDYFTVDVDQVDAAAANLTVQIRCK